MKVPLIFSVLFLAIAFASAQSSEDCLYTCEVTSQPNQNNDGNWAVILDNGVSYFYLIKYNAFVIVNLDLHLAVVINGNDGTLTVIHTDTGFGGIINILTNVIYFSETTQTFDITSVLDQDYSVIVSIVEFSLTFTSKVVGSDIDTSQTGYEDIIEVLRDYANTTDSTQWKTQQGDIDENRLKIATILHDLFNGQDEYTVEWGASMFVVVVTKMYENHDPLLEEFNDFAISIVRTLKGQFTSKLMEIYYKIIISQGSLSIEQITEQFRNLTWAINGVGTTYETFEEALHAYETQTVVQTYVSTIVISSNSSYLAYNSMRNGTWTFRITYSNQHYVQVTSSYYDEYMGIFDPSLEYVLVYTKTNQFGLINYKTGNGLVIDGFTQKGTYVIANNQEIVSAFAENRYIDGFKLVQALAENTEIQDGSSFNALELFTAVKNGDSYDNLLTEEQLASFKSDFASLADNLASVSFDNESGLSNIVGMMLAGPNSQFFQLGFVKMIYKMFDFQLSSGRLYRIAYAGILNSIETKWAEPIFDNLVTVMGYLKKNNSKEQLYVFLEQFVKLSWGIDVTAAAFTLDGSYN